MLDRLRSHVRSAAALAVSELVVRRNRPLGRDSVVGILLFDASDASPGVELTLERTREAVALLSTHSPVHTRWLQKHVNQVALGILPYAPALFEASSRTIFLRVDLGSRYDAAAIASMVAHEIAHARLWASGVRVHSRGRNLLSRIERRCVREQLTVIERVAPEHPFVAWSRDLLREGADDELTAVAEEARTRPARVYDALRRKGESRAVAKAVTVISAWLRRREGGSGVSGETEQPDERRR